MERDEESGLSYHGARFFTACIIRWISSDPTGILYGLNTYCYTLCNPLSLIDRNGQNAVPPEIAKLSDAQRKALLNPPAIVFKPLIPSGNSDSAPTLHGSTQAWNPRWETVQYQKQLEQDIRYRDHPLERINDRLEQHAQSDLIRWLSNWGTEKNYPGAAFPVTEAPMTRGAPRHEAMPLGPSKPASPTFSDGFSPIPTASKNENANKTSTAPHVGSVRPESVPVRIIDRVVNDVRVDPTEPLLAQKAGNVCVPATAAVIGSFHGTLPPDITVTKLEKLTKTNVGIGPMEQPFESPASAIEWVENATKLKATAAGKGNYFNPNNPGTWAIIEPLPKGGWHMSFALILPDNGGMFLWDPLTGGNTLELKSDVLFDKGLKFYKFQPNSPHNP